MFDLNDDDTVIEYLLGGLDTPAREQVFDQLGADEVFYERVAAVEDELIQRWHRQTLSDRQRERFERAYSAPGRRARLAAALAVLLAAEAEAAPVAEAGRRAEASAATPRGAAAVAGVVPPEVAPRDPVEVDVAPGLIAGVWAGVAAWLKAPWPAPRLAVGAVCAGLLAVAAVSAAVAVDASRRARAAEGVVATLREQVASGRQVLVAVHLSAAGARRQVSSGARPQAGPGMDRVSIPADAGEVQVTVEVADAPADGPITAELEAVDSRVVTRLPPPRLTRSGTTADVTVRLPAVALPAGDYLLRLQQVTAGTPEVIALQAFRVRRTAR